MRFFWICIVVILLFGCNKTHKGEGDGTRHSISIDNERRRFQVYTPKSYDKSKEYPVMIALHGRYGNARNMAKMTGFNPLADEHEFIVVYPNGYKRSWNDGRGESPASVDNIDDVKFIQGIIGFLTANYAIDEDRLFVSGMSNGGFMAMRLACEMATTFRACISVTGSLAANFNCVPNSNVNILLFAGTDDELVPYGGGEVASSGSFSKGFEELLDFWGEQNACSDFTTEKLPKTTDDITEIEKLSYTNCADNTTCTLYKIINGGHTWSMGNNFFGENTTGVSSEEINASETIIAFCLDL